MRYVVPSITLNAFGESGNSFKIVRVINSLDYSVGQVLERDQLQALMDSEAINIFIKEAAPEEA